MSFCFRKKARVLNVKVHQSNELNVLLNDKPLTYYHKTCLGTSLYFELAPHLKGTYELNIRGGGVSSQYELAEKVLYTYISDKEAKRHLKQKYPSIDRTDERKTYPKKYGGPKSRARTQKSYR